MKTIRSLVLGAAVITGFSVLAPQTSVFRDAPVLVKSAHADDQAFLSGAEKFVDGLSSRAVGFLANSKLSEAQKQNEFRKLLRSGFDMKTIGRFSMGRYWRTATPAQQAEYQKLFEKMLVGVYSSRFSEYSGQSIEVRKSRRDSEKDVTVMSAIVQDSGPEIQLDWRVRYKGGRYRVIDVVVEGVSMALTQRSDFSSVIQRGGGDVSVLIEHLREQ